MNAISEKLVGVTLDLKQTSYTRFSFKGLQIYFLETTPSYYSFVILKVFLMYLMENSFAE